jgi:hypothetical protein
MQRDLVENPAMLAAEPRGAITWRSILLGLAGVIFICGLTPYNDYALNNTFLVGNNLPLGVVLLLFPFILLINGPLNRWAPRSAFSPGEIGVALSMTLVSCALPSSGFMRYFFPSIIGPVWSSSGNPQHLALLEQLELPAWIFPSFEGERPVDWIVDPIMTGFTGRWIYDDPIPYGAWLVPAVTWGIFLFLLYGALMCMVSIVQQQWAENERLPFPLAQIYLSLIEPPERGRILNSLVSRRSFWVSFTFIFLLHTWNGLHLSWPEYFPRIPVYFDLNDLFTERPWVYTDVALRVQTVFFTVVGVTFFLSTPVAFSLWFFFILWQFYRVGLGTMTGDPATYGHPDQHFGGVIAFALVILWVGRRHWKMVIAQALRGARAGESRGRYLPYSIAAWGLVGCTGGMVLWLMVAGATLLGSAVMVLLLLLLFFVVTRIVAEAGLVHAALRVPIEKPWQLLTIYGVAQPVPTKTFYFSTLLQTVHFDFREVMPVYASHGLRVADQKVFDGREQRRDSPVDRGTGRRFIFLLMLALLVGYVVSFGSSLWTYYTHAWTQDVHAVLPNEWAMTVHGPRATLSVTQQYDEANYHPRHSAVGHFSFGFLFTMAMGLLRLTYTWWPLHPIGYLMIGTFPGSTLWFSIMIGWICKVLIVRFGGAKMYMDARPFFIGLIVGESIAAGGWLLVGVLLSSLDLPYAPVRIMPW